MFDFNLQDLVAPPPWGDIWHRQETSLVVTTWGARKCSWRLAVEARILKGTQHAQGKAENE